MTQDALAWNATHLSAPQTLDLNSPDFEHEGALPIAHAAARAGGRDLSPALAWSSPPEDTAQLLLVIEDPDAPMPQPYIHCLALIEPSTTRLPHGALDAAKPANGVRVLRSSTGRGYLGPMPPKSHGPHRYVLAAASGALARGRLDCFFARG